jgi:hypothetical protein
MKRPLPRKYAVTDIAWLWNLSADKVHDLFEDEASGERNLCLPTETFPLRTRAVSSEAACGLHKISNTKRAMLQIDARFRSSMHFDSNRQPQVRPTGWLGQTGFTNYPSYCFETPRPSTCTSR